MQGKMRIPRLDAGQYEMAFKVLVSPHAAGKIIGRGGSEIAALRQQLNVGCHIHGPETPFPGTNLQVAVYFGSHEGIDFALEGLVGKIAEAEDYMHQSAQLSVHVVMSSNAVSAVIGTKGATIARLRQQVGCGFSADKDKVHGEQVVRVTGPPERLPGALALLTPIIKQSGDSLQYAQQDYSGSTGSGGWDAGGGWRSAPPPHDRAPRPVMPAKGMPAKGMGKRTAAPPPWGGPAMQAIGGPAPPWHSSSAPPSAKRRIDSKGTWQFAKQGKGTAENAAAALAAAAAAAQEAEAEAEALEALEAEVEVEVEGEEGAAPEESIPQTDQTDDERVMSSPSTIAFPIPKDSIGRVLGRGGESSERIRKATGVSLNIEPSEGEGTVVLSGTLAGVQQAHCMVVARVMSKV